MWIPLDIILTINISLYQLYYHMMQAKQDKIDQADEVYLEVREKRHPSTKQDDDFAAAVNADVNGEQNSDNDDGNSHSLSPANSPTAGSPVASPVKLVRSEEDKFKSMVDFQSV
jgi:hypothetical protein